MPRDKLPKKTKIVIAQPKKSRIVISTPMKSKIDIRKKKETKILMPKALRAHMLEKEANRMYMRDMKTQNIEDKTEDKPENETEVDMFVVRGIPTAQRLNLPQKQNKPNKARVPTINGVPVTVPVGAKSSRTRAPVINDVPVTVPAAAKAPVVNEPVTVPVDVPVIVPAGAKSGSFRKRPKKLANTRTPIELKNTRTPIELKNTRTPIELLQPTLEDIVTLNAPNATSKTQKKIAKKLSRKPNIAPKTPALAPSPIKQPRLQEPISLPKPPPPKTRKPPLSQMQQEPLLQMQKVGINRPQRRKRNNRVTTNILHQAFNTKKTVDKVIKIQTVRRAQQARKATRARKEELERIERERIERERIERERIERERIERERIERERIEQERIERERKEREAVFRGQKRLKKERNEKERKNKQAAFLMLKRQKNKKMSNNKLTKKANEKRKKVAFNIIKKEKEELETYNGNNYYENNYEPYEPFNPEPVGRVSYVPYGQTENNVLEKIEMANTARHLFRQLEIGNKFTDILGDRTPANLIKNVLDENLSNNPIEVHEQLDDVIEILTQAATNIQTKYRGKKSRRNLNKLKRKQESILKNLGRFQQQKPNLIKKQLVRNQLVKGKGNKKLNMIMKAKVLGLDLETATKRDIERAYRKLTRLYHPNKNPNMDPSKIKHFFLIKEARNYLLRDVNEPSRTLDLQYTTLNPLALQYNPKNIIHPSLSNKHVPSYKHIPKRKRSVNDTQSIRKLRSTANVNRIKQRNEVKKAREKARVVEILDQHLLDMLNKRRKKLARMASAATKVQTTQRRRSELATRRRLAEQEQQRKRAGIERDLIIKAELNNANIERVKTERSQRGVMILNKKRKERIEREKREAQQAEDLRLAKKAAAELAVTAMTKGSEYVGAMRARGIAGKDAVKQHGKAVMQASAPLMSWVKGYVTNTAVAAGKWHADYQAERAERQKQEKIESDANKKRNNATRKVQARWRNKKRRRIERSKEAQQIRFEKNYILRELEEIKGLNSEILAKMRKFNKLGPYERWMAYINKLDIHETTARIKGRSNTDPPRLERNLVTWAKKEYGNLNLSGLITEIKRRPPISRSEVEREIQQMKQRKQTKSPLQRRLRELNEMYKKLFV